ncbi:cytochrome oxidase putative small subunit CydP [Methylosinus sp. LW4]|uniref:cytochrome oxidase putative small subunit CydP n=1 Tax=Methylosinus sp. LW4 TaxID=136993 RepID=UPI00037817D0|nr:cytochrome oxidase putative small subunit CydP [Methylosinus sp. LW4]
MSAHSATHRLGREIAIALALKIAALALLYFLCFPASQRPHVSPAAVAEKLFARNRG